MKQLYKTGSSLDRIQLQMDQKNQLVGDLREKIESFDQKAKSSKDTIRGLQVEYSEKNRLCERQRMRIEELEQEGVRAKEEIKMREEDLKAVKLQCDEAI